MMPLALALNAGLRLGLVARESLEPLRAKTVALDVTDLGIEVRVEYDGARFRSSPHRPHVTIRASVSGYLALLLRREDPDTLFFTRRLLMTGDTDLGLVVKNVLDAIDWGKLKRGLPPPFQAALARRTTSRESRPPAS
jgi:predicted lipid carrier protein YhbT